MSHIIRKKIGTKLPQGLCKNLPCGPYRSDLQALMLAALVLGLALRRGSGVL